MGTTGRWVTLILLGGTGDAAATLGISSQVVIQPPAATLLRGDTATITYTVTNTGDEPLDLAAVGTVYFGGGPRSTVFPFATGATPPCTVQFLDFVPPPGSGQPTTVANTNTFRPNPIEPGESRQCVMGLLVSPDAGHPFVQLFSFVGVRGGESVRAPQHVTFNLGEQPTPIPVSSWWGLVGMGTLLLLLGFPRLQVMRTRSR